MPTKSFDPSKPESLSADEAMRRIVLTLRDGETIFSDHVRRDIASGRHGTTIQDIVHVLQNGEIIQKPEWDENHSNWKYKVEGADLEDEHLRVITIIIDEEFRIFIVTAY